MLELLDARHWLSPRHFDEAPGRVESDGALGPYGAGHHARREPGATAKIVGQPWIRRRLREEARNLRLEHFGGEPQSPAGDVGIPKRVAAFAHPLALPVQPGDAVKYPMSSKHRGNSPVVSSSVSHRPRERNVRKLVLVRHSQPRIERNVPAAEWGLSDLGRRRAESMAANLRGYRVSLIWCSREPKAVETAEVLGNALGVPIRVKTGLEEHHRGNVPFFPTTQEFEQAVEAFFSQPSRLVLGSETASQARDRFAAAIEAVLEADSGDAIVITHGTVMTLYLARVADVEPMSFWRELQTPCLVEVELPHMRVGPIVVAGEGAPSP